MAQELIYADNFSPINIVEKSTLASDAAASQAVITAENAQGFSANDYVLVGEKGSDTAQILKISSVSTNAITFTSNLTVKHYRNEPIYKLRGNQIKFYRAANVDGTEPADGDFSTLTTSNIEADQVSTPYLDSSGGVDYWYLYTFYNQTSGAETSLADAIKSRGGNYGHYTTTDSIRTEAGLNNNQYITDSLIFEKQLSAESEINSKLAIAGFTLPLSPVPSVIKEITNLLAAGRILTIDYGPEHEGTNKDGEAKINRAYKMLQDFLTDQSDLVGDDGAIVEREAGVKGYPDDSAVTMTPSEDRMFKVTDVF